MGIITKIEIIAYNITASIRKVSIDFTLEYFGHLEQR